MLASKAEWYTSVLDGPIVAMKRSPFFKDIILIAGGTGFNIWREKVFVRYSLVYLCSEKNQTEIISKTNNLIYK